MTYRVVGLSALVAKTLSLGLVIAGTNLAFSSPASSAVRLNGCIKWWHGGQNKFYDFKYGEVEIEWDGAGKDPTKNTGADGCYKASVRNAYVGNGHNMNVQVYAKRKFSGVGGTYWVRAFENMTDIYPTYFESRQIHVNDNSTGTINVNIKSGTDYYKNGNFLGSQKGYYHWNVAAVDILGRYYDWAHEKGFSQRRSVDIIAPAWAPGNSYFNIATNNINLVSETNPGNTQYGGWQGWTFTVLHEGTHALHAHTSSWTTPPAAGLFQPTRHALTSITNPAVGWTEGFAAFLPVVYLTERGLLGQYAWRDYTGVAKDGLYKRVANDSFIENHTKRSGQTNVAGTLWGDTSWFNDSNSQGRGGSEGYVAGFLWDLYDSKASTAPHPDQAQLSKTNWNRNLSSKVSDAQLICQVEYTVPRVYRNLPVSNNAYADPWLSRSSDCLSDLRPIASVLSDSMKGNISDFGEAYLRLPGSNSDAIKYEVLKAYMTNGMSGALPRSIRSYKDLSVNQKSMTLEAYPETKLGSSPVDLNKAYGSVRVYIPVTVSSALDAQWNSSTCIIANNSSRSSCRTVKKDANYYVVANVPRTKFCTSFPNRGIVGSAESSPTYVALDDGVNPIAFRLANLCNTRLIAANPPF